MLWLAEVLRIVSALISVYILLIFLRILLLWFNGLSLGKAGDYLYVITEPYLALYRPLKFLRKGSMDFTPLAATMVLALVSSLLNMIAGSLIGGLPLTLGRVLFVILGFVWNGIFWIAVFFLVLCLVRAVSLFLSKSPMSGGWSLMDSFIGPFVHAIEKKMEKLVRRSVTYFQVLLVTAGLLVVFILAGSFLLGQLAYIIVISEL